MQHIITVSIYIAVQILAYIAYAYTLTWLTLIAAIINPELSYIELIFLPCIHIIVLIVFAALHIILVKNEDQKDIMNLHIQCLKISIIIAIMFISIIAFMYTV